MVTLDERQQRTIKKLRIQQVILGTLLVVVVLFTALIHSLLFYHMSRMDEKRTWSTAPAAIEALGEVDELQRLDVFPDIGPFHEDFMALAYKAGYGVEAMQELTEEARGDILKRVFVLRPDGEVIASSDPTLVGSNEYGAEAAFMAKVGRPTMVDLIDKNNAKGLVPIGGPAGQGDLILVVEFQDLVMLPSWALTVLALVDLLIFLFLAMGVHHFVGINRAVRHIARAMEERRFADLGRMSAVMAHEIRNPLVAIKMYAQLVGKEVDGDAKENLDTVVGEVVRLEGLVADLLGYAKERPLNRMAMEVCALVEDAKTMALQTAVDVDMDVQIECKPRDLTISADPQQLKQVFLNLLLNAIGVMEEGGTVRVDARETSAGIEVIVDDDGPGIPPELLPKLFEPYVTSHTHGTGLGLAVCKRIIEAHGGVIVAGGSPLGGARITITLPKEVS